MSGLFFIAGSFFAAWLLSPESLVLVSNLAGTNGLTAPLFIVGAALFSYFALLLTYYQSEQGVVSLGEKIILHGFGLAAASTLAVFLPTGMLVTAGFTFNETFLYWFPNFGFSATLLIVILAIHLTGEFAVQVAQRLFTSIAAGGLCIIILVGLLSQTGTTPEMHNASGDIPYFGLFALSLLPFLGSWHPAFRKISPAQLLLILLGGALLISLWQIVALQYVQAEKLASSTIPYIFTAREVMGQTGRIVIGITIISGTCAATNYFFSLATKYIHKLLDVTLTTGKSATIVDRLVVLLLTITIALCMASGLAGEAHLETYIYASLLLWLMSSAAQITVAWLRTKKIRYALLPAIFSFAPIYLIMTHGDPKTLIIFTALALSLSFLFSSAVLLLGRKTHQ